MSRVPSAYSVVEQNVLLGGGFKRIFDGDQKRGGKAARNTAYTEKTPQSRQASAGKKQNNGRETERAVDSIPRHLQIAQSFGIALHSYSPLPVVKAPRHGLIGLARLDNEVQIPGLKLPLDGVVLPLGAAPGFTGGEDNGFGGEHPAAAIALDQYAVAVLGLGTTFLGAQAKQHQLAAIGKLQGEPVPARLPLGQYRAAPLVIEPALTADVAGLAIQGQGAADGQARVGVVEGGVARALLAVTRFALQHHRLGGANPEIVFRTVAVLGFQRTFICGVA